MYYINVFLITVFINLYAHSIVFTYSFLLVSCLFSYYSVISCNIVTTVLSGGICNIFLVPAVLYTKYTYAKQNYNLLHFTASEVSNIDFTVFYLLQQEDIPYY
jgi:hypothetical protein